MLLDENGLRLAGFDPALAAMLGNDKPGEEGYKVLAEAVQRGARKVELRHWLYCLAKAPGTLVRAQLIDAVGKDPASFVNAVDGGIGPQKPSKDLPPGKLTAGVTAPEVFPALDAAEELARQHSRPAVNEAALTVAIVEKAGPTLKRMLQIWVREEETKRLQGFLALARSRIGGDVVVPPPFDEQGRLNASLLDASGRRLCQRLREDAASFGAKAITARHMLYSLLGHETGLLYQGLTIRGVDVKKELHTALSRQLSRPGAKRNLDLELTKDTMLGATVDVLRAAQQLARARGGERYSETDISRAFVREHPKALAELFPRDRPLDLAGLRTYLDTTEPSDEEEAKPLQRVTIAEIEKRINERIRGQGQAVARVMPWIKRLRFGLTRENRPAAVFLFLGPTGAGKTQMAKELARYVYGDEDMLIFLEMGQFGTKEAMSGFIGAPPGYVGYGEGKLTNGLRDKPECVVLFDEIEKANVEVFNTLLRFADEGLISDPAGPIRDGRRCIIVMTTNAGQSWLQRDYLKIDTIGRDANQVADVLAKARADEALPRQLLDAAQKELRERGFRPEFIARVDERVTFLPFDLPICTEILDDVLKGEREKLLKLKGVELLVEDEARQRLAKKAMVRTLDEGARGIPRTVNDYIINGAIDILTAAEDSGTPARKLRVFHFGVENARGKDVDVEAE